MWAPASFEDNTAWESGGDRTKFNGSAGQLRLHKSCMVVLPRNLGLVLTSLSHV